MSSDLSLKALINYNFDVSAKQTGKLLALDSNTVSGKRVKVLKEIDLKTASYATRIRLLCTGGFNIGKIGSFVLENEKKWSKELSGDENRHRQLEKQCAKLTQIVFSSKRVKEAVKASYESQFVWDLTGKIRYPTGDKPDSPMEEFEVNYSFDRVATNEAIHNLLLEECGELTVLACQLSMPLLDLFETHSYEGDYQGARDQSPFLSDSQPGRNRTFTLILKQPNQRKLGHHFAQACYTEFAKAMNQNK